jgi:hypothetical protein
MDRQANCRFAQIATAGRNHDEIAMVLAVSTSKPRTEVAQRCWGRLRRGALATLAVATHEVPVVHMTCRVPGSTMKRRYGVHRDLSRS